MYIKVFCAHIKTMRKPTHYCPLRNIDEREVFIKDFIKKEMKNEN